MLPALIVIATCIFAGGINNFSCPTYVCIAGTQCVLLYTLILSPDWAASVLGQVPEGFEGEKQASWPSPLQWQQPSPSQ